LEGLLLGSLVLFFGLLLGLLNRLQGLLFLLLSLVVAVIGGEAAAGQARWGLGSVPVLLYRAARRRRARAWRWLRPRRILAV
jgi:hypothetical protein